MYLPCLRVAVVPHTPLRAYLVCGLPQVFRSLLHELLSCHDLFLLGYRRTHLPFVNLRSKYQAFVESPDHIQFYPSSYGISCILVRQIKPVSSTLVSQLILRFLPL